MFIVCIIFFLFWGAIDSYSGQQESIKLSVHDTLILDETQEVIKGILCADISPDESKLILIDNTSLSIYQYNITNGMLLNYFHSYPGLNKYMYNKPNYRMDSERSCYSYLSNQIAINKNLDTNMILNDFQYLKYNNDTIYVSGFTRCFAIDTIHKNKNPKLQNMTCYYKFNNNLQLIYATPFEVYQSKWPDALGIIPVNDEIITCIRNFQDTITNHAFALFNSNGKYNKVLSDLPQEYIETNFAKYLFREPYTCKVNNKYYWSTKSDYKIRDIMSHNSFEIVGFDTTNKYSWQEYSELLKQIENSNISENFSTKQIFNLRAYIKKLYNWNDSLIAIHIRSKNDYIQLYDLLGQLKFFYKIEPPSNYKIISIVVAPKSRKIIAICSNDNNYILVNYYI